MAQSTSSNAVNPDPTNPTASWIKFLLDAGISNESATKYAATFVEQCITSHEDLTNEILIELDVNRIGDRINILKFASKPDSVQKDSTGGPLQLAGEQHIPRSKPPTASAPPIKSEMTRPEFRKLRIDWQVFQSMTRLPGTQLAAQIYTSCDQNVQTSIINSTQNFFELGEEAIFNLLEKIVTKHSNPSVHRLTFSNLTQSEGEAVKDFVVRLKSHARDCEFACPSCKYDMIPSNVKDQLIRGLQNSQLQTDILAKAETLKDLESIVKHAESFEAAVEDQLQLKDASEVMGAQTTYNRLKQSNLKSRRETSDINPKRDTSNATTRKRICPGCGSASNHIRSDCPAWGRKCHNCGAMNHFSKVCRQPKRNSSEVAANSEEESASAIIAHVRCDSVSDKIYPVNEDNTAFISANLTPMIGGKRKSTISFEVFADSGADICLSGEADAKKLNVRNSELNPCTKTVRAVGGSIINCKGWFRCEFEIWGNLTQQPIYVVSGNIDRIYMSRKACIETTILPKSFPLPLINNRANIASAETSLSLPRRPDTIPFSPIESNIPKLKSYLLEKFADSVFNRATPFRSMNSPPAHIHLKNDAKPVAIHNPFSVPIHWREEIKKKLDKDVEDGIIEKVPIGDPVTWCSPMVVATKADGSPRRTVDLQKLNQQCLRETHHCQSPFKLASQIPPETKKSILDATDGFHAIVLDEESRPLTTFITEWGRYRYKRLPQGYSASQDAYTRRYDELIKDIPDKVKCIDDALLYSGDIESSFFAVFDYLTLCARNGITINKKKFVFCQDTVTFAGLKVTPDGIRPSDELLAAIRNFPTPKNIHDARSWFGAVNQMAWAYATSSIMQPFRDLVKPSMKFAWNDTLDKLFHETNEHLVKICTNGIKTFDVKRRTCLQTDWSKSGIGYLLLQQHCNCNTAKAPVCCKDGWKLVFAGSRFTIEAESRYSPTEGELLAVTWSLQHARMFVLGCKDLIVSTDHRPLLGILKDRELSTIANPRLFRLKEKTLPFTFNVQYNPGKWHRGPDAFSRNPVIAMIAEEPSTEPTYPIDEVMVANTEASIAGIRLNDCDPVLTTEMLRSAATSDTTHKLLHQVVTDGFPRYRKDLKEELRIFWPVRDALSIMDGMVLMDDRIVIPSTHRRNILNALHAAHQGVSSMLARARKAVYWPGIDSDIRNKRYTCQTCNETAPSNPKEPLHMAPPPAYPYQQICLDLFHLGHHSYLVCVDRFSGWLTIWHFSKGATAKAVISACRSVFTQNGVSEEVWTDGGPQLGSSTEFKDFLKNWGVKHRLSSVDYPQSNGRAELAVKSAKRLLRENTTPDGSLDNDRAARAILQHRNTPVKDLGMSPAQLLLHRELRDHVPVNPTHYRLHKSWIMAASERETIYARRNENLESEYNKNARNLAPIPTQTKVMIQTQGKWNKSGYVVEVLPHRQYRIKVEGSGRVTLRNRRFLRQIPTTAKQHTTPPAFGFPTASQANHDYNAPPPGTGEPGAGGQVVLRGRARSERRSVTDLPPVATQPVVINTDNPPAVARSGTDVLPPIATQTVVNSDNPPAAAQSNMSNKVPKALRELYDYNAPPPGADGQVILQSRTRSERR